MTPGLVESSQHFVSENISDIAASECQVPGYWLAQSLFRMTEESQESHHHDKPRSLLRQMMCAAMINSVSFLQGASVSTSSIILHEMQNSSHHNQDDHSHLTNCTQSCHVSPEEQDLGPFFILNDFHITQEEGSWIGKWPNVFFEENFANLPY